MTNPTKYRPPGVRLATYGCETRDGIVRVALRKHDGRMTVAYPRVVDVRCPPPCGREHRVKLMWRTLGEGEELDADILI